ncbi:MAG: hypothetical protein WA133_10665, partial [Syntrophales bacterium]
IGKVTADKIWQFISKQEEALTMVAGEAFIKCAGKGAMPGLTKSVNNEQLDHVAANERDAPWNVALSPYFVDEQPYAYAVAIVGRDHLLLHRDTLRVLLQRQKIEVDVEDITE